MVKNIQNNGYIYFCFGPIIPVQGPGCHLYHGWAMSYSPATVTTGVKMTSQIHQLLK
jgi:hypothetical protein